MLRTTNKKSSIGSYALGVLFLLELSVSGYAQVVTPVEGESWLEHRHRAFGATSIFRPSATPCP